MTLSNACKLIRDQLGHDAESCLTPVETELGYKVNTLVTCRGFTIYMKYLEEHDGLRLFFDPKKSEHAYTLYKGRKVVWNDDCPPNELDITRECSRSRVLIVHSAFCFMARARRTADVARAAYAAARAADAAAAWAAGAAAYAAADAARTADAHARAGAAHVRKAFRAMIKWRKTQ